LPKNSGTTAGSKKVPPLRLACVQSPKGPGSRGANSVLRGRGEQDEVLDGAFREQRGVHRAQRPALGLAEEAYPPGPGGLDDLLDRAVHVVQDEVLQRQPRVLGAGDPEVQHKDVETFPGEVLDQAVARHEV
jgi:hypothetical protein